MKKNLIILIGLIAIPGILSAQSYYYCGFTDSPQLQWGEYTISYNEPILVQLRTVGELGQSGLVTCYLRPKTPIVVTVERSFSGFRHCWSRVGNNEVFQVNGLKFCWLVPFVLYQKPQQNYFRNEKPKATAPTIQETETITASPTPPSQEKTGTTLSPKPESSLSTPKPEKQFSDTKKGFWQKIKFLKLWRCKWYLLSGIILGFLLGYLFKKPNRKT